MLYGAGQAARIDDESSRRGQKNDQRLASIQIVFGNMEIELLDSGEGGGA